LARTTLLVVAPSAPVAWAPGAVPVSDSLRARILAGAGTTAGRAMAVMPATGRRVMSLPIGTAVPDGDTARVRRPMSERIAVPVGASGTVDAPWGELAEVEGVVVRTSPVPTHWLRPPVPMTASVTTSVATTAVAASPSDIAPAAPARAPAPRPRGATIDERVASTSVRIRKAAMMAFGLLVSVVALEAAARVGRR
jgi:hypothetical protein